MLADEQLFTTFYILLYLPTIRWQLGHECTTSLAPLIQNGIKQHPSHNLQNKIINNIKERTGPKLTPLIWKRLKKLNMDKYYYLTHPNFEI